MQIYTSFMSSSNYLTVRSLLKPSQIAASIVRASRKNQRCQTRWHETFVTITGYSERELRKVAYSEQSGCFKLNSTAVTSHGTNIGEIHSSPEKSPQKQSILLNIHNKEAHGLSNNASQS